MQLKHYIKTAISMLAVMLIGGLFIGCSEDDSNPANNNDNNDGSGGSSLVLPSGFAWLDTRGMGSRTGYIFNTNNTYQRLADNGVPLGAWRITVIGTWHTNGNTLFLASNTRTERRTFSISGNTLVIDGQLFYAREVVIR